MPATIEKSAGLSGNQLKILAMITMTCDHVGMQLLPQFPILRFIGRLAMPIYAYMIAEGCRYTHDRKQYFLRLASLALACQIVYFVAMRSLYQCILVTFSLSVITICAMEHAVKQQDSNSFAVAVGTITGDLILCLLLPRILPGFDIDYGLAGVMLPVLVYFGETKPAKLAMAAAGLVLVALDYGGGQWLALLSLIPLAAYSGQRGKWKIDQLFYWYYPAHLVVIYGISLLI